MIQNDCAFGILSIFDGQFLNLIYLTGLGWSFFFFLVFLFGLIAVWVRFRVGWWPHAIDNYIEEFFIFKILLTDSNRTSL